MKNALILGRLWEARACEETSRIAMEKNKPKTSQTQTTGTTPMPQAGPTLNEETNNSPVFRNRRRNNALKVKKQVRIAGTAQIPSARTDTEATSDVDSKIEFIEFRSKKLKKMVKVESKATSGGETDASSRRMRNRAARKEKLESLKKVAPQKVFTIKVKGDINSSIETYLDKCI